MDNVNAEQIAEQFLLLVDTYVDHKIDPQTCVHALLHTADLACRKYDLYPVKPLETN
jgi:hypothetical protein